MKDIEALRTLAGDRTPFTDLEWRKKLLTKIETPAAKPFVRQALAHLREMEAGIRSNSPLFTREHAREARSRIRSLLAKAIESLQSTPLTDKVLQEITESARKVGGKQTKGFKLYKGIPITVTSLWGSDVNKLNSLLKNTQVQGYPVYLNQTLVGIVPKLAAKELKGVNIPSGVEHDAHHLDFFETKEEDKPILDLVHKYRNLTGAKWELVSGQLYRANGVAYAWIASTPKLAEYIGKIVSGKDRNWSVATFSAPVVEQDNNPKYSKATITELFNLAVQMKNGPNKRINYDDLAAYFVNHPTTPVMMTKDIVYNLLEGNLQQSDTKELAKLLKRWRA